MKSSKIALIAAALALIAAFFALDPGPNFRLEYFKSQQAALDLYYRAEPLLTGFAFFTLYLVVTAVSLPLASVMALAAGAIFGLAWGALIVSFASSLGATLAFLASRFVLREFVRKKFGDKLCAIDAGVAKEGGYYLFALRLVPAFPFFMINLALGLTSMKTWTFYWVSQLGMLAGTLVYVYAGTQIARIDAPGAILSPELIASFVLLGLFPLAARKIADAVRARKACSNGAQAFSTALPTARAAQRLSIIIPALDEADGMVATLNSLCELRRHGHEVIVVDGGSSDDTAALAAGLADQTLVACAGRAEQMNAGARAASGDVLLFLHADSRLPACADRLVLQGLATSGAAWGRFDVRIAGGHPLLRVVEAMMNLRSRVTRICTGDQGIFVRREAFDAVGGYPNQALMEDIAISARLRRLSAPLCLRERCLTSARRWEHRGVLRTIVLMWWLRLQFALGVAPARLARAYRVRDH